MKKAFAVAFLALILLSGLPYSCAKKDVPTPDYPQLIGSWVGTTSQGTAITIWVNNENGLLYITSTDFQVYGPSGYIDYKQYNWEGLSLISNKQFHFTLGTGTSGESYLDGIFNLDDMSLQGNFAVYPPANTIDKITGSYLAYKK
jgi:hypothetical protein